MTELRQAKREQSPEAANIKILLDVHRVAALVDLVGQNFGELERSERVLEAVRALHTAAARLLDKVESATADNTIDGELWRGAARWYAP